ncbi:MAG: hypothetical protein KDC87_02630, partial [Planctomycetes bacterium]|nr:hypothetical protein [Planctomycetota bacterium]
LGCRGAQDPVVLRPHEAPPAARATAVPLQEAVAKKWIEVHALPTSSTRELLALRIEPRVHTQPWVRIDAGLAVGDSGGRMVSYQTVLVRVSDDRPQVVNLSYVYTARERPEQLAKQAAVSRVDNARLLSLIRHVDGLESPPDWRTVQVAAWMLAFDVPWSLLSPPARDARKPIGNQLVVSPKEMVGVLQLLQSAGFDRQEFAAWRQIAEDLDARIYRYETALESSSPEALVAFQKVCELYPIDAAAEVVTASFDRHRQHSDAVRFRRHALGVLRRDGSAVARGFIEQAASREDDEQLAREMNDALARPAAPK